MRALTVLFGGHLASEAFEPLAGGGGKSALALARERAAGFPGTEKTVLLAREGEEYPGLPGGVSLARRPSWTKKGVLEELSRLSSGEGRAYDLTYFAWADCPLLDRALAGALAERHIRYGAEYSYADGWPYGFAPELLAPGTAGVLFTILGEEDGPVERDCLFQAIQKDINAFDIETEIAPVDLRQYRLNLQADSKRNLLLVSRFLEGACTAASGAAAFIQAGQEVLRTLPAFYPVQVSGACPQSCALCPWPAYKGGGDSENSGFMGKERFGELLDRIAAFSGDGVIDLSLWGELSLHPDKMELIAMVLARPALSLVIESSGLGWKRGDLEALAAAAAAAPPRTNSLLASPLSWIISLDAWGEGRYRELRGPGFSEASECARTLLSLFPKDAYVQAVRVKGGEDDIEGFYLSWRDLVPGKNAAQVIIQKYDDFCGALPNLKASDLSPVKRRPCWHLMRDMNILLDGRAPACREDLGALKGEGDRPLLGNVFTSSLEEIWERGMALLREHCGGVYPGICAECDEYYTYNF
ncbi:MAG: spiro-SPASM protein [Treponema sp.]|nr:spiro-SPASM protein [Treponema sp.]